MVARLYNNSLHRRRPKSGCLHRLLCSSSDDTARLALSHFFTAEIGNGGRLAGWPARPLGAHNQHARCLRRRLRPAASSSMLFSACSTTSAPHRLLLADRRRPVDAPSAPSPVLGQLLARQLKLGSGGEATGSALSPLCKLLPKAK